MDGSHCLVVAPPSSACRASLRKSLIMPIPQFTKPWLGVLRFAPLLAHELVAACTLGLLGMLWFEGVKWGRRMAGIPQKSKGFPDVRHLR